MTMTAEPGSATSLTRWCVRTLAWASLACAALPVWAQNAIQSINTSQQGSTDVVRIELAQPLAALPKGFSIQSPPRVAVDLPGVSNAMGKSLLDFNQGNLRSINVAQGDERTRLVLNLKQAATYRAELQGKVLVLMVDTGGPPAFDGGCHHGACAFGPVRVGTDLRRKPESFDAVAAEYRLPTWHRRRRAGVSSTCRARRSGSTSASRAARWWSTSCVPPCRTACAAGSTSPISARRCRRSRPSRTVTGCA